MKRFSHPGTVQTYGFSPGEQSKTVSRNVSERGLEHAGPPVCACVRMWTHTCMDPHVVLVIGGAGEGAAAAGLGAVVRPLARVRPDVNFADVGRGEGAAAAFHWALEGLLP